jgi:hypothetical protein
MPTKRHSIIWAGLVRLDERGDNIAPTARITFEAGGWLPYQLATYWRPAEGGFFKDIAFVSAEACAGDPLTADEIAAAAAWLETEDGFWEANEEAIRQMEQEETY